MKKVLSVLFAFIIMISLPVTAQAAQKAEIATVSAEYTKIVVKIKKAKNAKLYELKYSFNKDFSNAKSKSSSRRKFKIKNLKTNQTVYIKVRYKAAKYSKWSDVETVKTKKAVNRSIDAVAKALKVKFNRTKYYQLIGAIDGKSYQKGDTTVEIYQYVKGSQEYKDMISGKYYVKCAAYNNGFVIIFPNEKSKKLIRQFKSLVIKD